MEDLAQAVKFIFDHQDELQVDVSGYSVWGGSADGIPFEQKKLVMLLCFW